MLDDSWFAVQTESRREQVAAHLLAQKGYECFLPTYAPSQPRRASAHADDKPLFPGYLFCRMTPGISAKLITTPAVLRIVSFGGRTAFISGQEIEHLKLVVRSGLPREPIPHLLPGNRVRIKSGPLEGAEGVIEVSQRKGRFVVSISLLQRSVAVAFDADTLAAMVEPIAAAPVSSAPQSRESSGFNHSQLPN